MTTLELTVDEAEFLAERIENWLSDLRMEMADTDASGFRDQLKHEKALLEALQVKLRQPAARPV